MNSGKYFESQFIKSFHALLSPPIWYAVRLKDIGMIKTADVGDYIVFHYGTVFNVELKSRDNGIIYNSEINSEYMKKQISKWKSFECKPYRNPILIIKNGETKEIGVFTVYDLDKELANNKISEEDAPIKLKFISSSNPYDLSLLFSEVEKYLKLTKTVEPI